MKHCAAWLLALPALACEPPRIEIETKPRAARIKVERSIADGEILRAPVGSPAPFACTVFDELGNVLDLDPRASTVRGTLAGETCSTMTIARSGVDAVIFEAETTTATTAISIAVPATMVAPIAESIRTDLLPELIWWAPSLHRNHAGEVELYVSGWPIGWDGNALVGGDLHRFVMMRDGTFRHDGIAIHHDPESCSLLGAGIENVAIVDRQEAPGLRMFFAAGSFECYGWQVHSAVSDDDGKTWTIEPGVRVSNGGTVPPEPSVTPPWPTGEGMVLYQPASGEWRMIVGGVAPEPEPLPEFAIVEWSSRDQLEWKFERTLIRREDLGIPAGRSIYSPTMAEIGPNMWRMIFAQDGPTLSTPTVLWSAISTNRVDWEIEGRFYQNEDLRFYYSTMIDDLLIFIAKDPAATMDGHYIAATRIDMP